MHLSPDEEAKIRGAFDAVVNMSRDELSAWLRTPESRKVGTIRRGETESVGRQMARKILDIRARAAADLTDADYRLMKKVIGFCRRHLANRPEAARTFGDITHTRWRWSLMNWGHDPLRAPGDVGSG